MPTVLIFKTRPVSKHMGSHPPGAHPQPTARARFSIPKDCHCWPARQPASLTFFSYLASFVHKWMQTLVAIGHRFAGVWPLQSAAQNFTSGSAMVFVRDSHKRHLDKNAVQKLLDGFLCSRTGHKSRTASQHILAGHWHQNAYLRTLPATAAANTRAK